jgi:hypothetical protein
MGFARILALIAVVLVVGGLLTAVVRVNGERKELAAQLAAVERQASEEQALRDQLGDQRRDLADLLEENDQLYVFIAGVEQRAAQAALWAPADCPREIREILRPLFDFFVAQLGQTGEDELPGPDILIFSRLCVGPPVGR